jgi:hypothetical protein
MTRAGGGAGRCAPGAPTFGALALAAALLAATSDVRAAFEVRDASPAALGSASLDLAAQPFFEGASDRGLSASASHATLDQADGLTCEQIRVALAGRLARVAVTWNQIGFPGAREHSLRATVDEATSGPIALSLTAERLLFAIEGEPGQGGVALGAAVSAHVALPLGTLECSLGGDRLARTSGLASLGVEPSFPFAVRIRAAGVSVGWMDRWEASGAASPRLVVDLALGGAAHLRMARGIHPDRGGAGLAIRMGRIEISVARLDRDAGGSVGSAALGLAPRNRALLPGAGL